MSDLYVDSSRPAQARVYDYLLGGTAHYAADRRLAEAVCATWPDARGLSLRCRAFLGRAVTHLAEAGIDQFLDLGSGLPTQDNVHQVAQRINPAARVLYVDVDPIVRAHGRALLAAGDNAVYVEADLRDTEFVLDQAAEQLDLSRPVGLLATSVLLYVPDPLTDVMCRYVDALAPGSALVIAHPTGERVAPKALAQFTASWDGNEYLRSPDEIRGLFCGLELDEPGLIDIEHWRAADRPGPLRMLAALARKP